MLNKLKYFLRHTVVYSLSNVMIKLAGFFLIPVYTDPSYLTAADFGLFGIIDVSLTIATEVLTFGQANSVLMFTNSDEYKEKRHSAFLTVIIFTSVIGFIFFVLVATFSPVVSSFFSEPEKYAVYLRWCGSVILFRVINNILLSKLRADEKSVKYTLVSILKTIIMLCLTIYLLTGLRLGVLGILYASFIAEVAAFLLMLPAVVNSFIKSGRLKLDKEILKAGIKFGFPLVFASIGSMLLNVSDRYILKIFTDFKTIAVYDLGYRIAGVINMLVILPFSLTLLPNAFKIFGTAGDKRYYSKLLTYLTFILVWLGLAQSFFAEEFLIFFTSDPLYMSSYKVVSIITLSYIFSGMRLVPALSFYFTKKTGYIAYLILFAAIFNIILNIIFIPLLGMMAAAYSTLAAFFIFHVSSQILANKYYFIPFENRKLYAAVLCGIILFLAVDMINTEDLLLKIVLKILALILFPLLLFMLKFYEKAELKGIKGFYKKWRNPGKWLDNIINFHSTEL